MSTTSSTRRSNPSRSILLPHGLALALALASPAIAAQRAHDFATSGSFAAGSAAPVALGPSSAQRQQSSQAWMRRVAGPAPMAPAGSIVVSNCDDAGPGSLRQAVLDAVSGDTIDLSKTGCSAITLSTGEIAIDIDDLTVQGPGASLLTVSGGDLYRIFRHDGTGTLSIDDLTISHGNAYVPVGESGNPYGGCVMSMGSVNLARSVVDSCQATNFTYGTKVKGGGVYSLAGASVVDSVISGNLVQTTGSFSLGGGLYTAGPLEVRSTLVTGNQTRPDFRGYGGGLQAGRTSFAEASLVLDKSLVELNTSSYGGGVFVNGPVLITSSTLTQNSGRDGGALYTYESGTETVALENTTISGNQAYFASGLALYGNVEISNCTIANNISLGTAHPGAGIQLVSATLDLQSSIVSGNTSNIGGNGPVPDDIGSGGAATVTGANNLVFASTLTLPADTLVGVDPLILPIGDNGGPTPTHALDPLSPAIDSGNDAGGFEFDQRGFPRTFGAATDIGAVEYGSTDTIFADGFDGS